MIVAGLELTRLTRMPSARLGAGVVELAGLADDDRPGPDDEHRPEVLTPGHGGHLPGRPRAAGGSPGPLHQGAERVELAGGVVRAGGRLRVVLHAERGH